MGSFKIGDLVTTTATACAFDPADRLRAGQVYVVESMDPAGWWLDPDPSDEDRLMVLVSEQSMQHATKETHASLERVFALAVAQSRDGKGADRHGNGKPFEDQPIVRDIAELGSNHGAIAQVRKKALESTRLAATGRKDMAMAELLGAMVYAGAAYLILEAECPGTA